MTQEWQERAAKYNFPEPDISNGMAVLAENWRMWQRTEIVLSSFAISRIFCSSPPATPAPPPPPPPQCLILHSDAAAKLAKVCELLNSPLYFKAPIQRDPSERGRMSD